LERLFLRAAEEPPASAGEERDPAPAPVPVEERLATAARFLRLRDFSHQVPR